MKFVAHASPHGDHPETVVAVQQGMRRLGVPTGCVLVSLRVVLRMRMLKTGAAEVEQLPGFGCHLGVAKHDGKYDTHPMFQTSARNVF